VACIKTEEKEETFFQTMVKQLGQGRIWSHLTER